MAKAYSGQTDKKRYCLRLLFSALIFCSLAGCRTATLYNVDKQPYGVGAVSQQQLKAVEQAIISAGTQLGWTVTPQAPGRLLGTLRLRDHVARVDIYYDNNNFSIFYKDSENLKYHNGIIHKNYNSWVVNLSNKIQAELLSKLGGG